MNEKVICMIAAVSENSVIGRGNQLPWRLSSDLKRFKELTLGHSVIMGRKTFESLPAGPLKDRQNIILSHKHSYKPEGAEVFHSVNTALKVAKSEKVFIIGGEEIYRQFMPRAHILYITRVHTKIDGDSFFPAIMYDQWKLVEKTEGEKGEKDEFDYSYETYVRK